MSNVIIDKNKVDLLANAISAKSGEPVTMTLDEMVEAVDGIEVGGGITPTGNIDITSAGTTDVTQYATVTVPEGELFADYGRWYGTESGQRKWYVTPQARPMTSGWVVANEVVDGATGTFNAIPTGTSVTPTESAQTIGGANTMMEGAVTVNAIPSQYIIPSGNLSITQNGTNIDVANYATVSVSVSGGSGYVWQDGLGNVHLSDDDGIPTLIAKSITQDGTYDPATDGADGYSYVTVNVGGGGGISGVAKGTLTVDADVNTSTNTQITDVSEIGFTPTQFFFWRNTATTAHNAICSSTFTTVGTKYCRVKELYSSQDALIRATGYSQDWTSPTAGCLYFSQNIVYVSTSSSNILKAGTYTWIAVE